MTDTDKMAATACYDGSSREPELEWCGDDGVHPHQRGPEYVRLFTAAQLEAARMEEREACIGILEASAAAWARMADESNCAISTTRMRARADECRGNADRIRGTRAAPRPTNASEMSDGR